jgi:hypothetical protein
VIPSHLRALPQGARTSSDRSTWTTSFSDYWMSDTLARSANRSVSKTPKLCQFVRLRGKYVSRSRRLLNFHHRSRLSEMYTGNILTSFDCSKCAASPQPRIISSSVITSTAVSRVWKPFYFCSATRSNIRKTFSCCGVIMNAQMSHEVS